jgi:hypothetical protein
MLNKFAVALGVLTFAASAMPSQAMPIQPLTDASSMVVQVADGCGGGRYRGPYGSCHRFGRGPYPGGYWGPWDHQYANNGCPPGYWHGPWGHCRDTPYHGRLPGGGWK